MKKTDEELLADYSKKLGLQCQLSVQSLIHIHETDMIRLEHLTRWYNSYLVSKTEGYEAGKKAFEEQLANGRYVDLYEIENLTIKQIMERYGSD